MPALTPRRPRRQSILEIQTSPAEQPAEPGFLRLVPTIEHPYIPRPLPDQGKEPGAVGMQAEARHAVDGSGQVDGREHFLGAGPHIDGVKLPLRPSPVVSRKTP